MDAFPAYFPLAGRKVVIAGSGPAADAKARLFEGSPAEIVRIDGDAALQARSYAGAILAFVATSDDSFAEAAALAARRAAVPVNVVDRPRLCDFTTPALIDRGEVVAAVGTAGASPMLATLLRHDIEARIPEGAGRIAVLLRRFQDEVRAAFPDLAQRRGFLRAALEGPAAEAAREGDMDRAASLLRDAIASGPAASGVVQFVAGRGPADLLTLRAVRAIAAGDVLACDADADPEIVALARRDAERLAPEAASPERLAALAAGGLRVVRVVASASLQAQAEAVRAAGARAEVLAAAAGT